MQPPSPSSSIDNPFYPHGEPQIRPWGWRWRSSYWFVTFVVWLGIATDLLIYSMVIPVVPFQLEKLGYKDVASLTGWLLFAYSGGLAMATIPVAVWSEKYDARKLPLVAGVIILIGSQIMFMEAPAYWFMCFARVLQGIGSTIVRVVGLALLCDETPPELVGRQLGIAMSGLSLGTLVGPPVGGGLYARFGFRGPFIFGIIIAFLDLASQFLIIEGKSASKIRSGTTEKPNNEIALEANDNSLADADANAQNKKVSFVQVLRLLFRSHRALAAAFLAFVYGVVYSAQDPIISNHLSSVWGLNSSEVGLVLLASAIPTLFASPLSGWFSDCQGAPVVIIVALVLNMPWYVVMIIDGYLALFITVFACAFFFGAGVLSLLTIELASVARSIDGIGYAHVYGTFNLAYGMGATVGSVVGGQMYDHISKGWLAICLLSTGLLGLSVVVAFFYIGDKPVAHSLIRHIRLL
ncbi:MFS general substrate transporter [Desarmillaria ectypa]|nr:MFS general substrate transporter [Desarmillaria ectypa]